MIPASALHRVRVWLALFVAGLVLSGATAFALPTETSLLARLIGDGTRMESLWPAMAHWISKVEGGVRASDAEYPFLFYGTDWLAFGHLVIAISFLGPIRDPVKNLWVGEFGMTACALVIPTALILGPIRGIPFFWRLIDCSFGVIGIIPLYFARREILRHR